MCPTGKLRNGCITKQSSVCFSVSVGRLEQECFYLATKSSGRPQQLELCQQSVPYPWCNYRKSQVADLLVSTQHGDSSTRSPDGKAHCADLPGMSEVYDPRVNEWRYVHIIYVHIYVSKSEIYTGIRQRSDLWTSNYNLYWILSGGAD